MKPMRRLIFTVFVLAMFSAPGITGGEIPWPRTLQSKIQSAKVQGLWVSPGHDYQHPPYVLNIEILHRTPRVYNIRISQLSFPDYEPLRQGELTVFSLSQNISAEHPLKARIPSLGAEDDLGSYITMRGFSENHGRALIRIVELGYSGGGGLLGVSELLEEGSVAGIELANAEWEGRVTHRAAYRLSDNLVCTKANGLLGRKGDRLLPPFECSKKPLSEE